MLNVYHYQLNNGLTILLIPRRNIYSLFVNLYVKVGSANENKENNGISHLLEHVVFYQRYNSENSFLANDMRSWAAKDFTNHELFTSKNQREKAIKLLANMIKEPDWSEIDLNKEKNIVKEEIKEYKDDPWEKINNLSAQYLYPNHSLSLPVLGSSETVSQIQLDDIKNWYRKYYSPNNMFLTVVGDISVNETYKEIEKYFNSTSKQDNKIPSISEFPEPSKQMKVKKIKSNSSFNYIVFIFPTPTPNFPYINKLSLLYELLDQYMTPVFNRSELYYDISFEYPKNLYAGSFNFYTACDYDNIEKIEEEIMTNLNNMKITPQKFQEIKDYLVEKKRTEKDELKQLSDSSLYFSLDTGKTKTIDDEIKGIQEISLSEIQNMKEEIFSQKNKYLFIVN